GNSDYISIDDGAAASLDFGSSTDFSVAIWIRTTIDGGRLIHHTDTSNTVLRWRAFIINDTVRVNINDGVGSGNINATGTTIITDGKWHLVVFTFDRDGDINLYIDGGPSEANIDMSGVGSLSDADKMFIGADHTPSVFIDGEIDDVRIYGDKLLSEAESTQMYELGTLNAMTAFTAAHYKEYITSRSGYFNNLVAFGGEITTGFLEITGGLDININASNLIGTGNILPETDGGEDIRAFSQLGKSHECRPHETGGVMDTGSVFLIGGMVIIIGIWAFLEWRDRR
ncbi:hypothetical protein LCGC14_3036410, partial [marine sediment metagenome]